ncbi:hypothetical protein BCR33DRAFT_722547 [Rhizoclosmatium globosum]|uniref:PTR2-domain-containing protein n=1 Tax=Rhizoclosmatium globosum TaxID=329046 RepID=A0A1Y2BKB9_9FUNG|nr:hypothetical protein BCR33DRAFT_722547 [Rhizoclosmatium globosum]|eukprot:ORY35199.1 hypothetical protein BCR33DRAFT_722547 [Rhizoclosmatium globosum]
MSDAVEVKNLESGLHDHQFAGLTTKLTPAQIKRNGIEEQRTRAIEEKLMANPDHMPTAVYFVNYPQRIGRAFLLLRSHSNPQELFEVPAGYLTKVEANSMYHIFQGLAYYTPLLGALISDSYLDKYKTIVILSCVYVLGLSILTITSWPTVMGVETTHIGRVGPLLGLLFIALGTGGIKPCFLETQKYGLQKFYNYFYMSINAGAVIASYASPAIQKREFFTFPEDTLAVWKAAGVKPIGNGYPQAFLMLTCFMACALGVFVFGYRYYRVVPPAGKFILIDIFAVAYVYIKNRFSCKTKDEAYQKTCDSHTEAAVVEMLDLAKVIGAIWPGPIFWMAFNQNGSTWQDIGDQMAIPFGGDKSTSFFTSETFGAEKFGLMQRMILGQFIAGLAFIMAALIQKSVNANCYDGGSPDSCQSSVSILWQFSFGKRTKSFCAALSLFTVGTGSFLATALLEATLGAKDTTWTRENFFYLVAGLCFLSCIIQYIISRTYVPKALRPTAHL